MSDNKPTLRGEIKKARASNYDFERALNEFYDNSFDTDASNIIVKFMISDDKKLQSIRISDNSTNGISKKYIQSIFSWTYERERTDDDIGEFGTGFKSASVNLGNKITLYTYDKQSNKYYQCEANWLDMEESNIWVPLLTEIESSYYLQKHNSEFKNGSTFIIDNLCTNFCPTNITSNWIEKYNINTSIYYKYMLSDKKMLYTELENNIYSIKDYTFNYFSIPCRKEIQTEINIYETQNGIIGVYNKNGLKYVELIKECKNGNFRIEIHDFVYNSSYKLLGTMKYKSCTTLGFDYDSTKNDEYNHLIMPYGSVDIIRNNRVVGKNIQKYRAIRGDGYANYIKHEIIYDSKNLNRLMGIQFNKNNDGYIPDNNLKYLFHYLQIQNEKQLITYNKQLEEEIRKKEDAEMRKKEEETQKKAVDEARKKEEVQKKAADEARKKEEAQKKAADEARKKAEEEARLKAPGDKSTEDEEVTEKDTEDEDTEDEDTDEETEDEDVTEEEEIELDITTKDENIIIKWNKMKASKYILSFIPEVLIDGKIEKDVILSTNNFTIQNNMLVKKNKPYRFRIKYLTDKWSTYTNFTEPIIVKSLSNKCYITGLNNSLVTNVNDSIYIGIDSIDKKLLDNPEYREGIFLLLLKEMKDSEIFIKLLKKYKINKLLSSIDELLALTKENIIFSENEKYKLNL